MPVIESGLGIAVVDMGDWRAEKDATARSRLPTPDTSYPTEVRAHFPAAGPAAEPGTADTAAAAGE